MARPKISPQKDSRTSSFAGSHQRGDRPGGSLTRSGDVTGDCTTMSGSTVIAAVKREEQFLERGLSAHELRDPDVGQDLEQRSDRASHLAASRVTFDLH